MLGIFWKNKSNRSIFCRNIWSLVLDFWNHFRAIKEKWDLASHYQPLSTKTVFTLMRWLLDPHVRMGADGQGVNHGIRGLELSVVPLPYLLGGDRGWKLSSITNDQRFNQSCLSNESSIKPLKDGFGELLGCQTWRWGEIGDECCQGVMVSVYQPGLWTKKKLQLILFINFCDVDTPNMADFKLPMWY